MQDQLYRRSLGLRYDPELLRREIANGYSVGHDKSEPFTPDEPGFELSPSDLYMGEMTGTVNAQRLQEIEYELSLDYINDDDRALLEAEKVVRLEQRRLDELAQEHPKYAEAVQEWLEREMTHLIESNVPIDDEMLVEAEILDQLIAEANEEREDQPLLKIAEVMKEVIEAQHVFKEVRAQVEHSLVAA